MATGTAGSDARRTHLPVVHYLRKTITYSNPGTGVAMTVGIVPAGAIILRAYAMVTTAFNDSGTDLMDIYIGAASGTTTFMSAVSVATVSLLVQSDDLATNTISYSASEQTVSAKYTGQNSDASAGSAEIVVEFIPNNG